MDINEIKKNHTLHGKFYKGDYAVALEYELIDRTIKIFGKKRLSLKKKVELLGELKWTDIAEEIRDMVG